MKKSNKLKVYLIAGEPSGDLLGSRLMRALQKKTNNQVDFFGLGGDTMEAEGLKSIFDISDLAIMGLVEVIPSIPKVLRHIKNTGVNAVGQFKLTKSRFFEAQKKYENLRTSNGLPLTYCPAYFVLGKR